MVLSDSCNAELWGTQLRCNLSSLPTALKFGKFAFLYALICSFLHILAWVASLWSCPFEAGCCALKLPFWSWLSCIEVALLKLVVVHWSCPFEAVCLALKLPFVHWSCPFEAGCHALKSPFWSWLSGIEVALFKSCTLPPFSGFGKHYMLL